MLEVRCCCKPDLLYGYLPVKDPYRGKRLEFAVKTASSAWQKLTLEVERLTTQAASPDAYVRLAIKSNDIPYPIIEQLPGFVPAEPDVLMQMNKSEAK